MQGKERVGNLQHLMLSSKSILLPGAETWGSRKPLAFLTPLLSGVGAQSSLLRKSNVLPIPTSQPHV